jgi:hypothetical protein
MKEPKETPKKKRTYKSAESRARQLAGLSGVKIEDHVMGTGIQKVNGSGPFATVPEEVRKQIIEMYCQGMSVRAIEARTGLSKSTINEIKTYAIDENSHLRDKLFTINLRHTLQNVADHAIDRVDEVIEEMSARDLVIALGVVTDKLMQLDKGKNPDQVHQHVHLHAPSELSNAFMDAMKPKTIENE